MLRLVRERRKPLTEQRLFTTIAPYISADSLSTLQKAADQGGDLAAPPIIPGLGDCYRASHGEFPTFDLGLDFGKSRAAKVISGVDPSGPAYKAGLRDGQPVMAWDIDRGDMERLAIVTVRVEGQDQKMSFQPIGKPMVAWQYESDTDKLCSARR